jgi:hypothetical protein
MSAVKIIERLERLECTHDGDPRYRVYFRDGTVALTHPDAGEVESPEFRFGPVRVDYDQSGRVWLVPCTPRREPYVADRPVSSRNVKVGYFAMVPQWVGGRVVSWECGSVIEITDFRGDDVTELPPGASDWSVLVRVPGVTISRYYAHSVMCGVCMGRDDVTCHQCPKCARCGQAQWSPVHVRSGESRHDYAPEG